MKPVALPLLISTLLSLVAVGPAGASPVWNAASCVNAPSYQSASCMSAGGTGYSATVSGWSASSTGKFQSAYVLPFDQGLGVMSSGESGSPQHAIDNKGRIDAILISFGTEFSLQQLTSAWIYGDADLSILRYTGEPAPTLGAYKVGTLAAASDWELVGNYSFANTSTALAVNEAGKTAAWWLVSAYSAKYGGSTPGLDNGDDYFKLTSFSGDFKVATPASGEVPEPGSLSLVGIALLGVALRRRRSHG